MIQENVYVLLIFWSDNVEHFVLFTAVYKTKTYKMRCDALKFFIDNIQKCAVWAAENFLHWKEFAESCTVFMVTGGTLMHLPPCISHHTLLSRPFFP